MTTDRDVVREQALDWAVRTGDPGFDGWDAFTAWLEQDSAHADAYHEIAAGLADADELLPALRPAEIPVDRQDHGARRRLAMAASVAILAAAGAVMLAPAFTSDSYSTAPGEMRTVTLADGNQLVLNGDTRLELAGLRRDQVILQEGQVLLRLEGEPGISVQSGDLRFVDIGTVFEVTRHGQQTRLLVSEGEVLADPDGARIRVAANQMLEAADGARSLAATAATGEAGGWADGQLSYDNASITQVLDDLHRSTGLVFSPSAAMTGRRFTGTLSTAGIRKDPASLGPLLGVPIRRSGIHWEVGES